VKIYLFIYFFFYICHPVVLVIITRGTQGVIIRPGIMYFILIAWR